MKNILLGLVFLISLPASAALIQGGSVDLEKGVILLEVSYSGGCKDHEFSLQIGGCLESMPAQCSAKLIHKRNGDFCEMYINRTIEISLEDAELNDPYYSGASLGITGDADSRVTIELP